MNENTAVWFDGEFVNSNEATESVLAHGLHFGAGVLEGIRYYDSPDGPVLFHWQDHLNRFYRSAGFFELEIEYTREELTHVVQELIRQTDSSNGYIRPLAYFGPGSGEGSLQDVENSSTRVVLIHWPRDSHPHKGGIDVMTSSWQRISSKQIPTTAKLTGPYASSMLAGLEATRYGYDDAIMLNDRGEVAEGTTANLILIHEDDLFTPSPAADVLDGITKNAVVEIAQDLGYSVDARTTIARSELYSADELFFVGTGAEITPIVTVDEVEVGSGSVGSHTSRIRERFFEIVQRKADDYETWFTHV